MCCSGSIAACSTAHSFPIGELCKDEVCATWRRGYGLPNRAKPDSVEICFVPDQDYARVVRERRPDAFKEGDVQDTAGQVVGRHKGIGHYTIGQRRGLGIAAGHPIYITELNVKDNTVTVGEDADLRRSALVGEPGKVPVRCRGRRGPFARHGQDSILTHACGRYGASSGCGPRTRRV